MHIIFQFGVGEFYQLKQSKEKMKKLFDGSKKEFFRNSEDMEKRLTELIRDCRIEILYYGFCHIGRGWGWIKEIHYKDRIKKNEKTI